MKKARAIRLLIIAALCVALSLVIFVACDKPDDGPDKTPEVTYSEIKGDKAFDAAYAGATKLAEKSAATLAANEYTAGIRVELGLRGENYVLKLDANVDGVTAGDNEIAAELYKGDSLRLGVYVFNRMLYVYDGEKYRFLDMFSTAEAPTVGVDLAGAIGKLGGIVKEYTAGALTERMEALYKDNLYIQLVRTLLTGYGGTLSSEGYYAMELPLGQLAVSVIPLLDMFNIDLGFELSSLSGLMKTLIGVSYEELTAEDFDPDAVADKLARLKLGFALNEAGELDELTINYALGESAVDIGLKELVLAEGRRDILPAELEQAAAGGIRITGESWLNGQKIYSDLRLAVDTKSSEGITMVFKAGSSAGADDYIYAIYSGKTLGRARLYAEDGSYTNANPDGVRGTFNARVNPAFMDIVSPFSTADFDDGFLGLRIYAIMDIFQIIDNVKELIAGLSVGETPAASAPAAADLGSVMGALGGLLGDMSVDGDGVNLGLTIDGVLGLLGAFIPTLDPEMDLASTVGDLVNSMSEFLNISTQLPHETDPNAEGYRPYYTLESLLGNLLGANVTRGLDLGAFLEAMALKLSVGLDLEDAFGLQLGIDLTTTAVEEEGGEPVTVSAGKSVFTVGFCDEVKAPSSDANFLLDIRESTIGMVYDMSGGIQLNEGENYADLYFGRGSKVEAMDTLVGFVTNIFGVLSGFALFG